MGFSRIRNPRLAAWVAAGVNRYNRLSISAQRLCRPHYVIVSDRKVVGWLGLEARGRRLMNSLLSVLPSTATAMPNSGAPVAGHDFPGWRQAGLSSGATTWRQWSAQVAACGSQARGSVVTYWRSV